MPGGFLGVEVFFVISGYLITGLLLTEWAASGRIDLGRFWVRRARRLLPALFVVLLATLAFAVVWLPDEVTRIRADAAAAAGYVSNWYLIFGEQSYFETAGRQSPLLHLWSLAVEEQFYVVWPLVLAAGLAAFRRRGMLVATALGAVASAAWMAALHDPATDPSRVYYGTDTRLTGLLLGALLAFAWIPRPQPLARPPSGLHFADLVAVAGATGLLWAFARLDGVDPSLYPGGFVLVGAATLALIVGAVHPAGHASGLLLDRAPMRWLGTRSYGVYLWHWPVFSVTRPGLDVPLDGPALLAVRLVVTAILAELSFRYVEWPIRHGALGRLVRAWQRDAGAAGAGAGRRTRTAAATLAGGLAVSALLVTVAAASPPDRPSYLPTDRVEGVIVGGGGLASPSPGAPAAESPASSPLPSPAPTIGPSPAATSAASDPPAPTRAPVAVPPAPVGTTAVPTPTPPPTAAPTRAPRPDLDVLAVGDSVLVDAAPALADALGRVEVDAAIGRQVDEGVAILERRRRAGTLPEVVVLNLGTNGPLLKAQFERAMVALQDVPIVVWVTVTVPRPWESHTNEVIARQAPRYGNVRVADWHAVSDGRPDLFWEDGYHPRPEGARLYAELIVDTIL